MPRPDRRDLPTDPGRRGTLRGLGALAGLAAWPSLAPAQVTFDLPTLMQTLAQVTSGEATFTERRSVAMLEHNLEFTGRLSFEAPDTFVRETLRPRQERLAVVGNNLTMSQGARSRTVPLDSVPQAAVIIDAVRGTLTGNREAIERRFGATVSGSVAHWSLELVPREASLRDVVSVIRVAGHQALVHEVTVTMADGDKSVMTIVPVAPSAAAPASAAS